MTVGSGLPDAFARWLARSGPRIAVIAVLAYVRVEGLEDILRAASAPTQQKP